MAGAGCANESGAMTDISLQKQPGPLAGARFVIEGVGDA